MTDTKLSDQVQMEDLIALARRLWEESERTLNILRSESGTPPKAATDREVVTWYYDLQKAQGRCS